MTAHVNAATCFVKDPSDSAMRHVVHYFYLHSHFIV